MRSKKLTPPDKVEINSAGQEFKLAPPSKIQNNSSYLVERISILLLDQVFKGPPSQGNPMITIIRWLKDSSSPSRDIKKAILRHTHKKSGCKDLILLCL